jgi:lipopolysaccharide biosynthesis glycosyltransferase
VAACMLNILVCTDNNYIIPLAALLNSLVETANNNKLTIHWFALEVSKSNIKKISVLSNLLGYEIKVYHFHESKISPKFFISGRITSAAYLRLYLADHIKNVNKVLYLDCDMIVLGNINDLWNYNLGEKVAAVVKDAEKINLSHLGKYIPRNYFNSGMMVINIDLWRDHNIQLKLFKLLNKKIHFRFHDQDLLNLTLNNKVSFINHRWNLIPSRENKNLIKYYAIVIKLGLEKVLKCNSIIHYAASKKPWHYLSSHPLKFLWWRHIRKTEFSSFTPEDKSFPNFLFKICPKPLRFLLSK